MPVAASVPVVEFDVKSLDDSQLGKVLGEIKEELKARGRAKDA